MQYCTYEMIWGRSEGMKAVKTHARVTAIPSNIAEARLARARPEQTNSDTHIPHSDSHLTDSAVCFLLLIFLPFTLIHRSKRDSTFYAHLSLNCWLQTAHYAKQTYYRSWCVQVEFMPIAHITTPRNLWLASCKITVSTCVKDPSYSKNHTRKCHKFAKLERKYLKWEK